jgi:hypothetical protein
MNPVLHLPPERPLPPDRHAAARTQLERYATSRRERIVSRWRSFAVVLGLGLGLTVAGGAAAGTIYLTRGPLPIAHGTLDIGHAPDFIRVASHGVIGYVPKRYILPSPVNAPANSLIAEVAPVYGPDLKTLVGHMYPGVGFVPLGKSPASVACVSEITGENGTTSTLPCPSITETVPNVVGMYTPTATGAIQQAGLQANVENGHSSSVPAGHIVRMSPPGGTKVPARTPVLIINSLGP